jgi:hypothetical protein
MDFQEMLAMLKMTVEALTTHVKVISVKDYPKDISVEIKEIAT